MHPVT